MTTESHKSTFTEAELEAERARRRARDEDEAWLDAELHDYAEAASLDDLTDDEIASDDDDFDDGGE